jgi:hypothetical protein
VSPRHFIGYAGAHCHSKRTTPSRMYLTACGRACNVQCANTIVAVRRPYVPKQSEVYAQYYSVNHKAAYIAYSNHCSFEWCNLSVHACDTRKNVIRPSFYSYRIDDISGLQIRSHLFQRVCVLYQTHETKTEACDIITNRRLAACRTTTCAISTNEWRKSAR